MGKMKIFASLFLTVFAVNLPANIDEKDANNFLSRQKRGKFSTGGKVLAGVGAGMVAGHVLTNAANQPRYNQYPPGGYGGGYGYNQGPQRGVYMNAEDRHEMEEVREEPEEEREG